MICSCSLAGTSACRSFSRNRGKKITEEYDKDGKMVKRVIEEG